MRTNAGGYRVDRPGPYHTYVYVVSEDDLSQMSFKRHPAVVAQERLCNSDGQCGSVANAVYLTPKDLADPAALVKALTAGVGLPEVEGDDTAGVSVTKE